jgi:hypothetical protein
MFKRINIKYLIGAACCFTVADLILFGKTGIQFDNLLAEIFCYALTCIIGVGLLVMGINKEK